MKKRGFTLIELLVVISIIALLLAILMPALNRVRQAARRVVCTSLIRSFGMSNILYAASHKGWFVPASEPRPSKSWDKRWCENESFRNNLTIESRVIIQDDGWNDAFFFPKELRCPSQIIQDVESYTADTMRTEGWRIVQSYGYNVEKWRKGGNISDPSVWWPRGELRAHQQARVKAPAQVMMFIDSNYYQARYYRANPGFWNGTLFPPGGESISRGNLGQVSYRHFGTAGVAYFDGHAASLPIDEIWDKDNVPPPFNLNLRRPHALWDTDREGLLP